MNLTRNVYSTDGLLSNFSVNALIGYIGPVTT